jgi:hypothetical protein
MTRIRGSLDIARSVGEVFDTVADQRNEPRYNPKMTASIKTHRRPIGARHRLQSNGFEPGHW